MTPLEAAIQQQPQQPDQPDQPNTLGIRELTEADTPELQNALPAMEVKNWNPEDPNATINAVYDSSGTIAFVRFSKTLRLSCGWVDTSDSPRTASVIIPTINNMIFRAKEAGFSELIIEVRNPVMRDFLAEKFKFTSRGKDLSLSLSL